MKGYTDTTASTRLAFNASGACWNGSATHVMPLTSTPAFSSWRIVESWLDVLTPGTAMRLPATSAGDEMPESLPAISATRAFSAVSTDR